MKKCILLFLMISLIWVPGVFAADIPAQGANLVQDEAGLLDSRDITAISKVTAGEAFTFHVLTVDSTEGRSAEDYANDIFDSWGLAARDVLLLIAVQNHDVQLVFENPPLQAAINTWAKDQGASSGSAALVKLLDTYFVPSAKHGDFAEGITSLLNAVQELGRAGSISGTTQSGSGAASGSQGSSSGAGSHGSGSAGTGSATGSHGSSSAGAGSATGSHGSSSAGAGSAALQDSGSRSSTAARATVFVGAALLLGALFVLLTGLRRSKQLGEQNEQLSGLLVRTNQALESLKPFQGIVQGKTGALVEAISTRLSTRLVDISARSGQDAKPALYRLGELKKTLEKLRQDNGAFSAALEEDEKQIEVINEADRHVKQRITALKKEIPELDEALQALIRETGYNLQAMVQDLQTLAEKAAKADQLELFDPIAAQEFTEDAQKRQTKIGKDLQDVSVYNDKLKAFSGVLSDTRTTISALITQHSLQNMKVRPYDHLEQAQAQAEVIKTPLQSGDMDEVRSIAARMDLLLSEAVAMTERQGQIRGQNRRDLETVRTNWTTLKQRRDELQSRFRDAGGRFAEQHLASAREALEEWGTRLQEGAGEVPQIETWTSDERGEFDQARSGLDRLLSLQDEASAQFSDISEGLDVLNSRLDKINRMLAEGPARVDAAQSLLKRNGLARRARSHNPLIADYEKLTLRLVSPPFHLDELETLARSYEAAISSFVEEANRLVRQKQEQERQAAMALMLEQQRQQQRQQQQTHNSNSFGGGNHSSGGSSWGSGDSNRSSGGSSWDGGGNDRSSGGSKW
ncbi:TPM domain-containing protein [Paenibacillus agri]|uniref:TPM domain-containing protein n=1 Tax=Paenibacillus agri TaxID=2744309 RepID=A0A850ENX7_9BACL|nr:TPM domain-containing protein [Paenibacillus agri]NUU61470.1 TPM domain-containing protein [Paenibacillus agri]